MMVRSRRRRRRKRVRQKGGFFMPNFAKKLDVGKLAVAAGLVRYKKKKKHKKEGVYGEK